MTGTEWFKKQREQINTIEIDSEERTHRGGRSGEEQKSIEAETKCERREWEDDSF